MNLVNGLIGFALTGFFLAFLLISFIVWTELRSRLGTAQASVIIVSVWLLFAGGFLVGVKAKADDYASAMVGIANSGKETHAETKFINIGRREPLVLGLSQQYEAGGWVDIAGNGRKSSGYFAYQLGVETDGQVQARVMAGPALITTPDAYLGGPFAFTEDFYIGLKGSNGNGVGILYKHISNAGLEPPNIGRDLAGVQVSIPW